MSKLMITCKHCGQRIKEENSRNGYCYKEIPKFIKKGEKTILIFKPYLDCRRYA